MRVCRESRTEALREYKLSFGTKTSPAQTYVNFRIDTVVFEKLMQFFPAVPKASRSAKLALGEDFKQLRHLALKEEFTWSGPVVSYQDFPNLRSIELILTSRTSRKLDNGAYVFEGVDRPPMFTSNGHFSSSAWNKSWTQKVIDHWGSSGKYPIPAISYKGLVKGSRVMPEAKRVEALVEETSGETGMQLADAEK
jgi:hypothetical protein